MKYLSFGSGNGQRRRAGITNLLACVIVAASAFIPGASTPSASTPGASTSGAYAPPPPVTVTVNDDGTFTPYDITIKQGEMIKWEGLDPTDSIVQISGPNLGIPIPDPCGIKDNIRDHAYDASDPNEFTGPMRKGVSGIFVLGPTTEGFVQKPADKGKGKDCNCEAKNQAPVPIPCGGGMRTPKPCDPAKVESDESLDGNSYKLCAGEAAPLQMLDSTWANPDVTGVTIRVHWRDIQVVKPASVVIPPPVVKPGPPVKPIALVKPAHVGYFWDNLDREMNRAVESGKLFILDVRAGQDGTPDWIFKDYKGPVGPGPVTKLTFKDWGSEAEPPTKDSCGSLVCLGSPTDAAYRDLYVAMIKEVAAHVASDSRWFQSLAHVKISGANLFSSEARLPKRCYDGNDDKILDTVGADPCLCNTKIWADAGYVPEGLYRYYRVVGNTIYNAFHQRKSMGYQLIQSGFPRVEGRTNFVGDTMTDQAGNLLGPAGSVTKDDPGDSIQTEKILEEGRTGRFVDPFGAGVDAVAGKLFVPQHSGLGRLPNDDPPPPGKTDRFCSQAMPVDTKLKRAIFPIETVTAGDRVTPGCPNPWAVDEGTLFSMVTGFQTNNEKGVGSSIDLESALWNLTLNSNAVFIEIYEERLWEIQHTLGVGKDAKALDAARTNSGSPYSRNLFDWSEDLHKRRRMLVDPANPHLQDPFPASYTHTFSKVLAAPQTYYFINPSKCSRSSEASRVGKITVTP